MEEKSMDDGQEKMPAQNASHSEAGGPQKSNAMIWIAVAVVVIVIGIIYFSRGGYKNSSPLPSAPATTPSPSGATQNSSQDNIQTSATAVTIQNFAFSPADLKIKKGDTVTWTNEDSAPHQIASDTTGKFQGPSFSKGQTYSFTFNDTGTFPYHCVIHPMMKATVTVE
jgi:amicyanin